MAMHPICDVLLDPFETNCLPIPRIYGHHPADTAAWVGDIAVVTRDDVDVELSDRLAGGGAVVQADVEAVRCWGEGGSEVPDAPVDPGHQAGPFVGGQFAEAFHGAFRDDEGMAGCLRRLIPMPERSVNGI